MIPSNFEVVPEPSSFPGMFRGKVEAVDDPLLMGRVRVRVFPMYAGIPAEDLPWAHPAWPLSGATDVPPVGTTVWVFFEANGDPQQPVYWARSAGATDNGKTPLNPEESRKVSGAAFAAKAKALVKKVARALGGTWDEPTPPDPAKSTYPLNRVLKTAGGHLFEVDNTPGSQRIHAYHPAGSWIEILPDGSMVWHSAKDTVRVSANDELVEVKENFELTAGKAVGIKAPKVVIAADEIRLGGPDGQHPAVLGDKLIDWLEKHTHVGNMGAPTPLTPGLAALLRTALSTVVRVSR